MLIKCMDIFNKVVLDMSIKSLFLCKCISLPRANFLRVGLGLFVSSAYQCPL